MTTSQTEFRAALLDADVAVPEGLCAPDGRPAGSRFSVYRNNVVVSLSEALATAFPLIRKLLGDENFGRLAGQYVRSDPPRSPLMMHYGQSFPAFLEQFEPLAHIGYLADCARLDLAMRRSYHAADAVPLSAEDLQHPEPDTLRLPPAPATQILRSAWPLYDLWRYNTVSGAPKPRATAQDVLITRPEFDPAPVLLPPGAAAWFEALASDQPLGQAHDSAIAETADFDLSGAIALALQTKALTCANTKDKTR